MQMQHEDLMDRRALEAHLIDFLHWLGRLVGVTGGKKGPPERLALPS